MIRIQFHSLNLNTDWHFMIIKIPIFLYNMQIWTYHSTLQNNADLITAKVQKNFNQSDSLRLKCKYSGGGMFLQNTNKILEPLWWHQVVFSCHFELLNKELTQNKHPWTVRLVVTSSIAVFKTYRVQKLKFSLSTYSSHSNFKI